MSINSQTRYVSTKGVRKKIIALGLGTAMVGATIGATVHSVYASIKSSGQYVIAMAEDIPDDDYQNAVPLKNKDEEIIEVSNNAVVIVEDDKIREKKKKNKVLVLDNGKIVEGTIEGQYLKTSNIQVSSKVLEECNEIYKVKPDIGVNLREKPTIANSNILCGLAQGELVLGGEVVSSKSNEFLWQNVVYINENQIIKGYIKEDLLEKVGSISNSKDEKEKDKKTNGVVEDTKDWNKMIVDTNSKNEGLDLNCRINAGIEEEIIANIPNGSIVYASEESVSIEARNWIKIKYIDKDNREIIGWVLEEYLKEAIVKMQVNTSEVGNAPLKLREAPSLDSNVLLAIENGKIIFVDEDDLANKKEKDGYNWVKVKVGEKTGYVASEYLEDVKEEILPSNENNLELDEIQNRIISNLQTNSSGNVTGIDISNMTPEQLEAIYNKGIIQSTIETSYLGNVDINDINGKINYVIIRIGGTYELNPEFETDNTEEFYIPLVKKCEELGIPYGFYYYSASIDDNEADLEFQKIKISIDSLKSELSELNYNLLPFAVDVECNSEADRQFGKDVTYAKAVLTNKLQDYLGKEIILYGAGKAVTSYYGNNILNLEEYNKLTGVTKVWIPTPKEEYFGSQIGQLNLDMMNLVSEESNNKMKVVMQQVILDGSIDGVGVDIDTIDKETFIEFIKGKQNERSINESDISER